MYSPSALFSKAYTYASRIYDQVAILSAKYGLLLPDDVIDPYDLTLNKMPIDERQQWSEKVLEQMKKKLYLDEIDEVFFHAGKRYRELLIPTLEGMGKKCLVPLEGLSYMVNNSNGIIGRIERMLSSHLTLIPRVSKNYL